MPRPPTYIFHDGDTKNKTKMEVVSARLKELRGVAKRHNLGHLCDQLVVPWLACDTSYVVELLEPEPLQTQQQCQTQSDAMRTSVPNASGIANETGDRHRRCSAQQCHVMTAASQPAYVTTLTCAPGRPRAAAEYDWDEEADLLLSELGPRREREESPSDTPNWLDEQPTTLQDLFEGDLREDPWQYNSYSADNKVWQGAAMRRRQHSRRTNVSFGVCTVDLSGPHEPTPRPGKHFQQDTCTYFLVLTSGQIV